MAAGALLGGAAAHAEAVDARASAIRYADFGAKGDGVADDFDAIIAAHEHANAHGLPVRADEGVEEHAKAVAIDGGLVAQGDAVVDDAAHELRLHEVHGDLDHHGDRRENEPEGVRTEQMDEAAHVRGSGRRSS